MQIAIFLTVITNAVGYTWNLPGDAGWPAKAEWEGLRGSLEGSLDIRGDVTFFAIVQNKRAGLPQPAAVAGVQTERDITKCMEFANKFNIRLAVAGQMTHPDMRGTVDNALLIRIYNFNKISVNKTEKTVSFGTGVTWAALHDAINKTSEDLYIPSDYYTQSSPYAWAASGGYGPLTRLAGYGVDSLISATVVLPNGTSTTASGDLLWSLRGSGGNAYGIVTHLTMKLFHRSLTGTGYMGIYKSGGDYACLKNLTEYIKTASEYVTLNSEAVNNAVSPSVAVYFYCLAERSVCIGEIERFAGVMPECQNVENNCVALPLNNFHEFYNAKPRFPSITANFVSFLASPTNIDSVMQEITEFIITSNVSTYYQEVGCMWDTVGGVAATLDPNGHATSISEHLRGALLVVKCGALIQSTCTSAPLDYFNMVHVNSFLKKVQKVTPTQYWGSPPHVYMLPEVYGPLYWGRSYEKLVAVKSEVDPANALTCYQCPGWVEPETTDPAMCPICLCSCSNNPTGGCSDVKALN